MLVVCGEGNWKAAFGQLLIFLEAACSIDHKLLLSNNASNTNGHQIQHPPYHHLAKDLPGPVHLTLSRWNFSVSILIREIMV